MTTTFHRSTTRIRMPFLWKCFERATCLPVEVIMTGLKILIDFSSLLIQICKWSEHNAMIFCLWSSFAALISSKDPSCVTSTLIGSELLLLSLNADPRTFSKVRMWYEDEEKLSSSRRIERLFCVGKFVCSSLQS